ncbi:MAG: bifunctional phosphopantothenoylcysteine decarboxylase/phosphopantothenate--cysteine ligase CoaBC [Bacteroidota bacterium]|jgi:phosphopantothenoylcysteine decarboxylase/phosphopantothenate--cysteine ligase
MFGKRILLGITGGIAAYKTASLVRLLKKSGAEVRCVLTPSASSFISPLVLSTLSQNEVYIEFWNKETGVWNNHVELALWADVMLIAPATANTISKMANGACDNLLLATYLSLKCPCIVAPAMDLDMYQHPSFKRNLATLDADKVRVIPATFGALASGLEGQGRMEEPENIATYLAAFFAAQAIESKTPKEKVLITAGPTQEAIDPVRYISNHSTGTMGFALAEAALLRGAEVLLITGPTQLHLQHPNLTRIDINSADEMLVAVQQHWSNADLGIFTAAVADYKVAQVSTQKIKKTEQTLQLELSKNPDVLAWASAHRSQQKVVGFALETNNQEENALVKLQAKNLDFIVLNSPQEGLSGFGAPTNIITIFGAKGQHHALPLMSKFAAAQAIFEIIEEKHHEK